MRIVMVKYTVKKEALGEAKKAIHSFLEQIEKNESKTIRYEIFQNALTFVHLMHFKDERADHEHRNSDHTRHFVSLIHPLCDGEPESMELSVVGKKE